MKWRTMDSAPRDGRMILGIRFNDIHWEYRIIRWVGKQPYPWRGQGGDWPDSRVDFWTHLLAPPDGMNCGVCGQVFWPTRVDAHYCSDACRMKAYRKRKRRGA